MQWRWLQNREDGLSTTRKEKASDKQQSLKITVWQLLGFI